MADPYFDASTGCLRNRLRLTDPDLLQNAERAASALREQALRIHGLPGNYDLAHLREFHRQIFQDIYEWAGEIRTVPIAKTHPFCLPAFIEEQSTQLFTQLAEERQLKELDHGAFVERLTYYLAELNAIHPFREGNGRTQRLFFELLARNAGYRLDWSQTSEAQNITASVAAMEGNLGPLLKLIRQATMSQG